MKPIQAAGLLERTRLDFEVQAVVADGSIRIPAEAGSDFGH